MASDRITRMLLSLLLGLSASQTANSMTAHLPTKTIQQFLALPSLPSLSPIAATFAGFVNEHVTVLSITLSSTPTTTSTQTDEVWSGTVGSGSYYPSYTGVPLTSAGIFAVGFNETCYTHRLWLGEDEDVFTDASCTKHLASGTVWECNCKILTVNTTYISASTSDVWITHGRTLASSTVIETDNLYLIGIASILHAPTVTASATATSHSQQPSSKSTS